MCIFLRKHFRRPYCVPQINSAAFDICLTWFSKEFSVFWVAACKWAERCSLLNRLTQEGDSEAGYSLSLARSPVLLKPSLAWDPEAKGKNQKHTGTTSAIISPFLALGAHKKSQNQKDCNLESSGFEIEGRLWSLSNTERKWVADTSEASSGSWGTSGFLSCTPVIK